MRAVQLSDIAEDGSIISVSSLFFSHRPDVLVLRGEGESFSPSDITQLSLI